jgi:hypothetical protein
MNVGGETFIPLVPSYSARYAGKFMENPLGVVGSSAFPSQWPPVAIIVNCPLIRLDMREK